MKYVLLLALTTAALGQQPAPASPQVFLDTTYLPNVTSVIPAHTVAQFAAALAAATPNQAIVLDAGVTYVGNFTLPKKTTGKGWVYITTGNFVEKHPQGVRIAPAADAADMAKIVTTNTAAALTVATGAAHYWLTGLEIYSASTKGGNTKASPPANPFSYQLLNSTWAIGQPFSDSIYVDRCYLHGSPSVDVMRAVSVQGSNYAVVDSYISDIHGYQVDSQTIAAWFSPGPIKIVNNFLEATGENVLFGGAGGVSNPNVPSDIEIRGNYFFKNPAWEAVGVTIPPKNPWGVKNHLEFKSARRVVVDHNIFENVWVSAQMGYSILYTVRTSQSGNVAVVDDIDVTNNVFRNVVSGGETGPSDGYCATTTGCTNPGEVKRIRIYNNLIGLHNPALPGYSSGFGILFGQNAVDTVFQHNTVTPYSGQACGQAVYFSNALKPFPPPAGVSASTNVWVLDNALCHLAAGDSAPGGLLANVLTYMMGLPSTPPSDLAHRFYGNEIFVPAGTAPVTLPAGNMVTSTPFTYSASGAMSSPAWTTTTDGKQAGYSPQ